MASQSESAKAERARQSLCAPTAVGGFKFNPGKRTRRDRRADGSTRGLKAAEKRAAAAAAIAAAAKGA